MTERNLKLNEFLEREGKSEELKKSKRLAQKYIENLTFRQLIRATEKKTKLLRKTS